MNQEFFSVKEVAVLFGCHHTTIRKAIKKGFLIALRLGDGKKSQYRISKKSIDEIHLSIIHELASKHKKS